MTSLIELFHASPEECFEEIGRALKELGQTTQRASKDIQQIAELLDKVVLGRLSTHTPTAARSWVYDARLPNKYFQDVLDLEVGEFGAKRWVGKTGQIFGELLLPRQVQYDFQVTIVDFISQEAEASFSLSIDGKFYPWLSISERVYRTIVQEAPAQEYLAFALSVDPASVIGHDLSFSFSSLRVTAL